MRAWTLVAVFLTAALAGCVGSEGTDETLDKATAFPVDWSLNALTYGDDHDHTDPAHHANFTTANFEVLGHDDLSGSYYDAPAGSWFCGDAKETDDGRRIAAAESRSNVAFTLADVTDPADPVFLGELIMEHTYVYDLAVMPSGDHVVLTTAYARTPSLPAPGLDAMTATPGSGPEAGTDDTPRLLWRSPCAEGGEMPVRLASDDLVPRPASNLLVDISDPSDPVVVDQRPAGGLGHSVFATAVDGMQIALVSVWGDAEKASTFQFYEVVDTPTGGMLDLLTVYSVGQNDQDADTLARETGHNDGWIATHPVTGQTLAYLGNWDAGVHILDMEDPRDPTFVGAWVPPAGVGGNIHSVFPLPETRDGHHYTLVGPEWPARPSDDLPTGIVWVLDTTDPAAPKEVAGWTLPHDVEWSGRLMYSNHYLTAVDDTMFVSMYHGGVWAIDLGPVDPDNFTSLPSVGVFMPTNVPAVEAAVKNRWAPTQEEVLAMPDGTLVTWDANSGIYTFRFDAHDPAPAPQPWSLEPVTWTP